MADNPFARSSKLRTSFMDPINKDNEGGRVDPANILISNNNDYIDLSDLVFDHKGKRPIRDTPKITIKELRR